MNWIWRPLTRRKIQRKRDQNQRHTCPSGPYRPGCRSERGKSPEILLQHNIPVEARGEQAPAVLDSPRQPPARRVVPPVPVVLVVVLHINHAHPLVMSAMNRGLWQRSMRSLRKSLLGGRRCGTLSTRKTLRTSTINTGSLLNNRPCGTLLRSGSVDVFYSRNR